jgi:hypothetical protein
LAATVGQQIEITLRSEESAVRNTAPRRFPPLQSDSRASRWHVRRTRAGQRLSTFSRQLPRERRRSKFLLCI